MASKRNSDELSPIPSEPSKRYLFEPKTLIKTNRFYIPETNIADQVSTETQNSQSGSQTDETHSQTPTTKTKIPPIYLHEAGMYQEVLKDIKTNTTKEFTTVAKGKFLRINLSSPEDYRKLTTFYNQHQLKYHTFKNPDDNKLSVMIRNIPISLSEEEVKSELLILNYSVQKVARLYNKDKYPIPLCAVELDKTDNVNEIFNLTKINYSIVSVEPRRKSKDIPQCKRCQRYGHTKNYCLLEPRCVKCTGAHLYTDCPKKPTDKVQCVNCGGEHPANHKRCSYYTQISRQLHPTQNYTTTTRLNERRTNNRPVRPNLTFSNILNPSQTNQQNPDQNTSNILESILKTIIDLLIPHIKPLLLQLIPTLISNGSG